MLELDHLSKQYDTPGDTPPLVVLDTISLQVNAGESVAIVGPSGSGKSTLLNILGTLDKPSSGSVRFNNRDLASLSENEASAFRNREIGFVFQLHHLLPQCTVMENVLIPTIVQQDASHVEERAVALLRRVGLQNHIDYYPTQLSGGERQRVAVVRALINKPKLLLADEPTGSLDHKASQTMGTLLAELNEEQGVTLIVVTHSRELAQQMQRVFSLSDGRLASEQA